ncbi:hypothetical protein CSOJ01_15704 [Colletotrichum sojae]|uniref:Uncharacterized protein n=1 Tax=Colletotrichum sojae TaxID=2175907 RepID=A0A8H6IMV5_9PEZI|nr:hypothetical protein CSOJ01_15704 [Colletotrichum sojae]
MGIVLEAEDSCSFSAPDFGVDDCEEVESTRRLSGLEFNEGESAIGLGSCSAILATYVELLGTISLSDSCLPECGFWTPSVSSAEDSGYPRAAAKVDAGFGWAPIIDSIRRGRVRGGNLVEGTVGFRMGCLLQYQSQQDPRKTLRTLKDWGGRLTASSDRQIVTSSF